MTTGPPRRRPPARLHVDIVASQAALNQLLDQFDRFCRSQRMPVGLCREVHLALDEIVSNVITHGARGPRRPRIEVTLALDARALTITMADDGLPFNPMTVAAPNLLAPITERPIGGLGVHLIRNMMSRVEYRRRHDRNELRLTRLVTSGDPKRPKKPRRATPSR